MEDSKPRQTRRRLDEQCWEAVLERFDGTAMGSMPFRVELDFTTYGC